MWGSALDHVEEVEVVLANSTVVRASEKENPDVFFAVKGAAAGFGIVTEFKVRTQAEPSEAVLYTYNIQGGSSEDRAEAFKKWQELISDPNLSRKFASRFILTEQFGAIITGTFFGTQKEYDSLNISARLPNSDDSVIELKDWLGVVGHWAEDVALDIVGGIPSNFYAKSLAYTKDDIIPDDGIDKLFDYIEKTDKGNAIWFIIWDLEGGAINDVAPNATAYGHRNALFYHQAYAVNLLGKVSDKTKNFLTGVNDAVTDALPEHDEGAYAGYVDPALGENSASLYWGGNVERLETIKAQLDPNDVFHNPQSNRPAKRSARMKRML
jgi:FAD/FMN-containing dehydrogenase